MIINMRYSHTAQIQLSITWLTGFTQCVHLTITVWQTLDWKTGQLVATCRHRQALFMYSPNEKTSLWCQYICMSSIHYDVRS